MRTRRQRGGTKLKSGSPAQQTRTGRSVKAPKPANYNVPDRPVTTRRTKTYLTARRLAKAKQSALFKPQSKLQVTQKRGKPVSIASVLGAPALTPAQRSKLRTQHSRQKFHSFGPLKQGLLKMVRQISAVSGYKLAEGKRESKSARRAIDPLAAETQCVKVIGKAKPGQKCWICGYKIDVTANASSPIGPVCEHVLPAFGANIYLDLVRSLREDPTETHKLEYRWAHILCNNQKSDEFLIQLTEDRKFETDEYNCRVLLNNIIDKFNGEINIDIEAQIKEMKDTTLQPLCDFLNTSFPGQHKMQMLAGVGRLVALLEEQQGKRKARAALKGTTLGEQLSAVMENSEENSENTNMSRRSGSSRGSRSGSRSGSSGSSK